MAPQARLCVALLGTFISSFLECRELEGYEFPVYSTNVCPRNGTEWKSRSSAINCTENNGYMCLPNENRTELLEFCYIYPQISIEKDQSCSQIKNGCFSAELNCKSGIPPDSTESTRKIPGPSAYDRYSTNNDLVIVGTVLGLTIICVSSVLFIVFRRKFTASQENPDVERRPLVHDNNQNTNESKSLQEKAMLDDWQQDEQYFVSTKACKEVEHKIKTEKLVIVKGHSGSGKSAIIHHIALEYKDQGWTVKPIHGVEEFLNVYCSMKSDSKTLFVIDDPFGKESFDEVKYNSWDTVEYLIKRGDGVSDNENTRSNDTENKSVSFKQNFKIMMSSRNFEYHAQGIFYDKSSILDINEARYKLTNHEKLTILHKYTPDIHISEEKCAEIIKNETYFPLLCKLYSRNKKYQEEGVRFFEEPKDELVKEIRSFRSKDDIKYCSLMLLVFFNNNLNIEGLLEGETLTEKFKRALCLFGLKENTAPYIIKDKLKILDGFLVRKIDNTYHFSHDFVMEVTNYILGTDYPLAMIEYADIGFIGRRVRISSCRNNNDSLIVYLNDHTKDLGKRLFREMFGERFLDVILNPCMGNEDVIGIFEEEIKEDPKILNLFLEKKILRSTLEERTRSLYHLPTTKLSFVMLESELSPLSALMAFCHNDLSLSCLKTLEKMQIDFKNRSLFSAVCCNGSIEMFKMFLNEYAKQCLIEKWGCYNPIHTVCVFHNYEILEELIMIGASVNQNLMFNNRYGLTPLTIAVIGYTEEKEANKKSNRQARRNETVSLLLRNDANVNSCISLTKCPLLEACKYGNERTVELLLNNDADINKRDVFDSAISIACIKGHENIVHVLIQNGAKINTLNAFGTTPLYDACTNGHENIVRFLLKSNANINLSGCNQQYPLHGACINGHESIVRLLLSNDADINVVNNASESPLFKACQSGCEKLVQLLINKGANVNQNDKGKGCPILGACKPGHVSIVNLMLKHDAEVNLCDNNGFTPLSEACEYGHEELAELFLAKGASINALSRHWGGPLHQACINGHEHIVRLLVKNDADVNLCDGKKITPIHAACENGHEIIVQILLENGADINAISEESGSPLRKACEKGHEDIVQILLQRGANITLCSENKITPIYAACENGREYIVEVLLQNGADHNLCSDNNIAPIHKACENGHERIVEILLDNEASINAVSEDGNSPLLLACKNGHERISSLLIKNDADFNICCKNGISPLHGACRKGLENIVELLLEKGASINAVGITCGSPLFEACKNGHENIVLLLLDNDADVNICHKYEINFFREAFEDGRESYISLSSHKNVDFGRCIEKKITPLYKACQNKSENIVKHLLAKRADTNLSGENKITPLHKACESGDKTIVQLLLKHNADIKIVSKDSGGPLHGACEKGHASIVELLLDKGVDINEDSEFRGSPLHAACQFGHDSIVKLLLKENADINAVNKYLGNPIHQACKNGHCSIVKLLIINGAEINAVRTTSGSPLHEACEHGHKNIVRLLLKSGAKIDVYNEDGKSPICNAIEYENDSILQLLMENIIDKCDDIGENSDEMSKYLYNF